MSGRNTLSYDQVESFLNCEIPQDLEDEILATLANYNIEKDMTTDDLENYFEDLKLPKELYKLANKQNLIVSNTRVVDFEKILKFTYHLLIFMDNESTIDELWSVLIKYSGRDAQFPNVLLKNHILSTKDLQKISNSIGMDNSSGIIEMMNIATNGLKVYLNYLDFAYILGKLGYLRYQKS
ncbi:hypothetical protein KAFR_0C05460 [Kazachstania africana CBS 2517]|uniref:DNA repair protein RAD33 n=1 Tax=Kazachstania africana (strain ATCC 22294 / BCRC 22015 / CBS 2517 / CECT 1963 / NBRC 1671 / NRRL Y-8276) TaxID=1071382 RepID=H2AT37_KAZAF|nr:hypothetical protein KAFR_0C05460 [Kazachstania africana CBS 2517]CCF57537.1 hypothetical protein KAFR_0C05460 [Kazachstania africana CBS 2517]